ncbi:MAG TPA: peptidoglycan-binding domain-containing protein [Burkholderiales bacterium]|nr:peptidoglycan-binding domain-containing protein [Burkholderiales bacterium]
MAVYQMGSHGAQVRQIQEALKAKGLYRGPVDGDFGGGTQAAVMAFQRSSTLGADGRVGPETWRKLFETTAEVPAPDIHAQNLAARCLALTGSFETGVGVPDCYCGISGDFDGQGMSFGVLQWNFGQGSLQPLLLEMASEHADVMEQIFGTQLRALKEALGASHEDLMNFARSVQHPVKHTVFEPWRGYARALGRTPEFQRIQVKHANGNFQQALSLCREYDLWSERAVALMFDIVTQNGSIRKITRAQILADIQALPSGLPDAEREVMKLEIVANRRAEAANPRWVDDVRRRKLCIARGRGMVHGISYDMEEQFGIRLQRHSGG